MISQSELVALIKSAEQAGASVTVTYDQQALREEGRKIVDTVQVSGLKGCGPYSMSAIGAAERLRECLHQQAVAR